MDMNVIKNEQTPKVPDVIDVHVWYEENKSNVTSFFNYAKGRLDALGLAANQVSLNGERMMLRCCACLFPMEKRWELIIDPKIKEYHGEPLHLREGCLTWPDKLVVVDRYQKISVSYHSVDENGELEFVEKDLNGLHAQVFQHEYDHLEGVEENVVERDYLTIRRKESKVGNNDPCPCGATVDGKPVKYKKCCLRKNSR